MKFAVLVSGTGSLLEAMLATGLPIGLVVADRPCRGIGLAEDAGIAAVVLERSSFADSFDRDAYTANMVDLLAEHEIDVVAMAGFGTVLGEKMFESFGGRVVNTHPALLPAFPGWTAVRDALDYGVKVTGCTIHVATANVDDGPILAQEAVEVLPDDDESSLHERIKSVERRLYTETLLAVVERDHVLSSESRTR